MLTARNRDRRMLIEGPPNRADLEYICDELNMKDYPERRDELRTLIERWRQSGPNLRKMLEDDPGLEEELRDAWRVKYFALDAPNAVLTLLPTRLKNTSRQWAVGLFAAFTLNPEFDKLEGPCGYRKCGKYFIRKRSRETKYCSRACNQAASAARSGKLRYDAERRSKLERAAKLIAKWTKVRTQDDWKTFVCKHDPEITRKFLTRAATAGDIVAPRSLKRAA